MRGANRAALNFAPDPRAMMFRMPRSEAARTTPATTTVTIDNVEELRLRFDGTPGIKNDPAGAGWTSLCLYTDGAIHPSANGGRARAAVRKRTGAASRNDLEGERGPS